MVDSNSLQPALTNHPPSYWIRTFGCQMNVADSLVYARIMESLGYVRGDSEESSDILIVNTCSVRDKAEEKAISYLGAISARRKKIQIQTGLLTKGGIAFVGCMATVRGDEILRRFPEVKILVPAKELGGFEDRIISTWPQFPGVVKTDADFPLLRPEEKFERFVPIVRGCVNRCTYCIVPNARGDRIESRPRSDIFSEVKTLIESGVKSITFLGQNVCAYGTEIESGDWDDTPPGYGFPDLLSDIRDRFGDRDVWFRFLTSHPRDVTNDLIDIIAGHDAFSKHFHLPLQAGDDEILKRMARGYTSEFYLSLIRRIRERIPDARLSTDIIVGFPGEDGAAFENTMSMLREIRFDAAFTFQYSPRSGTPAEKWADPVPRDVKKRRLQHLIDLQNKITLECAVKKIGEVREVLLEGQSSRNPGMMAGRTRNEELVLVEGRDDETGRKIMVELTEANLRSFIGRRLKP